MTGPEFNAWRALRAAAGAVFGDRWWAAKVGSGGLMALSVLGLLLPQGLLVEHLDNSRKGYPLPLPPWRPIPDKLIMGMLALIFDFAYFLLPVLVMLVGSFCVVLPSIVVGDGFGTGGLNLGWSVLLVLLLGCWSIAFLCSFSPIAKVGFAKDGEMEAYLGRKLIRQALSPRDRGLYFKARLVTLPLYGPAALGGALTWWLISTNTGGTVSMLLSGWFTATALVLAWLMVGQVYLAVGLIVEDREIDARLAARKAALDS